MLIIVTLLTLWWVAPVCVRLITEIVATIIGIVITGRAHRAANAILALGKRHDRQPPDYDRMPSRAERCVLSAGLRSAIRQTEFTSLFPDTALRAQRIVMDWSRRERAHLR